MTTDLGVTETAPGAQELQERARGPFAGVKSLFVVGVCLIGLFLRLWVLGRQPLNADVAVVGLMAHEILRGHFFAFYWGQNYGGGEPYLVALVFGIFGQSNLSLGMVPVVLDGLAAVLLWRIGTRLFSARVGLFAALLFWVWPEVYLWQSTIEYGFRWLALDCGLVILLVSLRVADRAAAPRRVRSPLSWVVLGAAAGLGWWCTPEIVYYLVPSVLLLIWASLRGRLRPAAIELVGAASAAALGALPWLWDNLGHGFPSLRSGPEPKNTLIDHWRVFFGHSLPLLLGLERRISGRWVPDRPLGEALYIVAIGAMLATLVVLIRRQEALVLVLFVVLAPLFFALSPFTWYWGDGRYALYFSPMICLLVAFGLETSVSGMKHRWPSWPLARLSDTGALAMLVVLALVLSLDGAARLSPYRPLRLVDSARSSWTSWQVDPNGYVDSLLSSLKAHHIHDVFAGYWIAEPLVFESHGAVISSDIIFDRYQPYYQAVVASAAPAWVFVQSEHRPRAVAEIGSPYVDPACVAGLACLTAGELEQYLKSQAIHYSLLSSGDFVVLRPARAVSPGAVISQFKLLVG